MIHVWHKLIDAISKRSFAEIRIILWVAILLPALCVVWLLLKTVENERIAIERLVLETRERAFSAAEEKLKFWIKNIHTGLKGDSPQEIFFDAVLEGKVDAVVVRDGDRILYPSSSDAYLPADLKTGKMAKSRFDEIRQEFAESNREEFEDWILNEVFVGSSIDSLYFDSGHALGPMIALWLFRNSPEDASVAYDLFVDASTNYRRWKYSSRQRIHMLGQLSENDLAAALLKAENLAARWMKDPSSFIIADDEESEHLVLFERETFITAASQLLSRGEQRIPIKVIFEETEGNASAIRSLAGAFEGLGLAIDEEASNHGGFSQNSHSRAYIWISVFVVGISVIFSFVLTELIRRRVRLTQMKNDLVSTVTHELKTPIASTRLLVDTLLKKDSLDVVRTQEYLRLISRENIRLGHLIENFLSFSRMERNRTKFELKLDSPIDVADEAEATFIDRFSEEKFNLECDFEDSIPEVMMDREALKTALGNLLENAFKYGGPERSIVFRLRSDSDGVHFEIEDNGEGIPDSDKKRIFDRFYQTQSSKEEQRGGVGLGLSIVSFIVAGHGGNISVDSELGRGSVFKIWLPNV